VIKDFQKSKYGSTWHPGCSYDQFRQKVIPSIVKYDQEMIEKMTFYQDAVKGRFDSQDLKKIKKPATDLIIVKNPNNPYPVFQQFLKSKKYSKHDLYIAFKILSAADVKLKTTGQSPPVVLEEAILNICSKAE
jgi:hypothetical protein